MTSLVRELERKGQIMFVAPPGNIVVLVIVCRHSSVTIMAVAVSKG